MKEKNVKNILLIIFRVLSIIIIIICLIVLFMWQKDNSSNNKLQNNLSSLISIKEVEFTSDINNTEKNVPDNITNSNDINDFNVDFAALEKINSETVAWIKINNTNINYPVVQSNDNFYYLTRNFNKDTNSAGWIYADCMNNFKTLDKNTIIYGHNRRNGTMFSNLNYYLNSEWCSDKNNKFFNFITKEQSFIAEIFSVYKVTSKESNISNTFSSNEDFQKALDNWKNISIYDFKTDVTIEDNLLSLYTCDNNNSYRILIISKLIPIN